MTQVEPSEIKVESRQRKWFDPLKMEELKQSIKQDGLLQLPICYPDGGGGYTLVAGERRFRVMTELITELEFIRYLDTECEDGKLPVAVFDSALDALRAQELELVENIKRQDLTWQERTQAIAAIHTLRCAQNPQQTFSATATEISNGVGSTSGAATIKQHVTLAQNLHIPEVASAKTPKEAIRALNEVLERQFRTGLAAIEPTPTVDRHRLIIGDSLEELTKLPTGQFNVILTDPPYGIGASNFEGQSGRALTHTYNDDRSYVNNLIAILPDELFRVTTPDAHLFLFCDYDYLGDWESTLTFAGWEVWPRPLIWVKNGGHTPRPYHGPARGYEMILYALKGDAQICKVGTDALRYDIVQGKLHPAQKPVELYAELLSWCLKYPDMTVLDPFCGSGTIFPAAHKHCCLATGIELDPATGTIARERITKECK